MSFQFRFASLLELRRRQRDEAGAAVGQALEAISKIQQQRGDIESERKQIRMDTSVQLAGRLSVDRLLTHGRYEMQLANQAESLLETDEQLLQALAQRQRRLVEAEAEVKRFERLEERERVAFHQELRRREQHESDDAAGRRHSMANHHRNQRRESDRL